MNDDLQSRPNLRILFGCFGSFRKKRVEVSDHSSCACQSEISLFDRNIGDSYVEELANDLIDARAQVAVLNLSRNMIGDAAISALSKAFESQNVSLQRVILAQNPGIGLAGTTALGRSLKISRIVSLNLTECSIGNKECSALSAGLIENPDLKELFLHSNVISDEGAVALGAALSKNSSLQTLDLSGNPVGEVGLEGIILGLSGNQAMRKLYLNDTRMSLKSLRNMVNLVEFNNTLICLQTRTHSLEWSCEQKKLQKLLEFYLELNNNGRRLLQEQPPRALLSLTMSRISDRSDLMYALLREVPHLLAS